MKDIMDRTNRFYIEMSRKVLTDMEYEVLQKLLIEQLSLQELAQQYGVTREYIRQIYERTYKKVKCVTELLTEIDAYKHKLQQLKQDLKKGSHQIKKEKIKLKLASVKNSTIAISLLVRECITCSKFWMFIP